MAKKKIAEFDNYREYYGHETQEQMERHMYAAAGRRHYSASLDSVQSKPDNEAFDVCQKYDSVAAYNRAGLNARSGADNDKESLEYSRNAKVGTKTQSNSKKKRK